jgi:hypothetical protein
MNKFLIALFCLLLASPIFAAEGFSSLEEQMSGKEFSGAGLDKLSQSELDALNAWIRSRSLATLDTPKGGVAVAADEPKEDQPESNSEDADDADAAADDDDDDKERVAITSNLVGKFTGWDGQTTFKLKNGQVWVQADKDKFYTKEIKNPVVVIEPGMFGSWHLRVEEFDSKCKVKRIQ